MTIQAVTQVLEDGPRNYVVRLTATLQAGDAETFVEKIDIADVGKSSNGASATRLSLMELRASTINASFSLHWEAADPADRAHLWAFPANLSDHQKFKKFGGIQNNAVGYTGSVLLSTADWNDPELDGSYDITLWFRKKY